MTTMTDKKRGLGRGLEALLGQAAPRPIHDVPPAREQLTHVPVDLLQKGKYQPRQDMREESLVELADSIKAQGIVQPIVVRPLGAPRLTQRQCLGPELFQCRACHRTASCCHRIRQAYCA